MVCGPKAFSGHREFNEMMHVLLGRLFFIRK